MAEESQGQKTEEPTPKRLRDARRKGQVALSRDLSSATVLAAAVGALVASGAHLVGVLVGALGRSFAAVATPSATSPQSVLRDGLVTGLTAILPLLAAVVVLPALVSFLQVGAVFATDPVTPRLERLNPLAGLKKIFSLNSLVETLKAAVKLAALLGVAALVVRASLVDVVRTVEAPIPLIADLIAGLATRVAVAAAIVFAALAGLDVLYQRWRHRKELRMSKYEVKREHRETEGDPYHRAERQRLHREVLAHHVLQEVRRATVVVVNPEHVAVALSYERDGETAPRVVAKGDDLLAQRIIQVAREAGIPVVRNVPLAHALNRLELGEEIPDELFEAVAEVLRFVYSLAEPEP